MPLSDRRRSTGGLWKRCFPHRRIPSDISFCTIFQRATSRYLFPIPDAHVKDDNSNNTGSYLHPTKYINCLLNSGDFFLRPLFFHLLLRTKGCWLAGFRVHCTCIGSVGAHCTHFDLPVQSSGHWQWVIFSVTRRSSNFLLQGVPLILLKLKARRSPAAAWSLYPEIIPPCFAKIRLHSTICRPLSVSP